MSNETNVATATAPVLNSEKLTALKATATQLWAEIGKFADPFAPEAKNAKLAFLKAESEISAEMSQLQKSANDAKIAEARNQRIALVTNLLTAHAAFLTAPKTATAETKQTLQTALETASEAVTNELLAKYVASKPAKSNDGSEAKTGGRDTEQKAAILDAARSGKTNAEIVEMGYKRSTVWHTINNAKKSGETFPNA